MTGTSYVVLPFSDLREAVELLREIEWSLNAPASGEGRCPLCAKLAVRRHDPTCRLGQFLSRMAQIGAKEWAGEQWRRIGE